MVEKNHKHSVEVLGLRRQGIVKFTHDSNDVFHDRFRGTFGPGFCRELVEQNLGVLRINLAIGGDCAREKLGRITTTSAQLGDLHARFNAEKREHLRRHPASIKGAVRLRAIGRRNDSRMGRRCDNLDRMYSRQRRRRLGRRFGGGVVDRGRVEDRRRVLRRRCHATSERQKEQRSELDPASIRHAKKLA